MGHHHEYRFFETSANNILLTASDDISVCGAQPSMHSEPVSRDLHSPMRSCFLYLLASNRTVLRQGLMCMFLVHARDGAPLHDERRCERGHAYFAYSMDSGMRLYPRRGACGRSELDVRA